MRTFSASKRKKLPTPTPPADDDDDDDDAENKKQGAGCRVQGGTTAQQYVRIVPGSCCGIRGCQSVWPQLVRQINAGCRDHVLSTAGIAGPVLDSSPLHTITPPLPTRTVFFLPYVRIR